MGVVPVVEILNVEKQYGALRPLRLRELRIAEGTCTMLLGFDRAGAEVFINLITGAALPDKGEVISFGKHTRDIADSAEWLTFVERFGIVSDRVVLLEAMTVAQNLALSYDLNLDPVPDAVIARVRTLAADVGIDAPMLDVRAGDADPLLQARVRLARALALDPGLLILEHPTAGLPAEARDRYATTVKYVGSRRGLTTLGLTADETFAKQTQGRLLRWQPATGECRGRGFWPFA
jgi:ABC-type transporter Mla maintaining outer membrane lipid asymmetry ATPase subunit MlaF